MSIEIKKKDQHPAQGMLTWSRVQGRAKMYGSDLDHLSYVTVRLHASEDVRNLSRTWRFAKERLMEVRMSSTQFAQFLTSPNQGEGAPCTIEFVTGPGEMPRWEPPEAETKLFKHEVDEDLVELKKYMTLVVDQLDMVLRQKTVRKGDVQAIRGLAERLKQHLFSNMPFVEEQFRRAMSKVVQSAKAEVESYVEARIHAAGLEALKNASPVLALEQDDSDPEG